MPLNETEKAEMRLATREAAQVLLEDMKFIRSYLTGSESTDGAVRQTSVNLRRLLLDGHLNAVAAPRIGSIKIPVPDNPPLFDNYAEDVVSVGIAPLFGNKARVFEAIRITLNTGETVVPLSADDVPMRDVTPDGLLADRIARFEGQPITRADVLKFICYHAFGVHYTGKEKPVYALIRRLRYLFAIERGVPNGFELTFWGVDAARPSRMKLDFAHAHAFSTGYYLVTAPDMLRLEALIEAELASA